MSCLPSVAPVKKAAPGDPPPPPPPEETKDAPAEQAVEEEEKEQFFEFMGHQIKLPKLKLPPLPGWARTIVDYRFPDSIDPVTSKFFVLVLRTNTGRENRFTYFKF